MTFPRFLKDPLLLGSGRRLLELWKPLLLWHGIVGLLFFLLLTPLGSWILGFELFRGDAPVIANIDLLSWALSWRGFLHLCLLLGIGLLGSVVRFSGIFLLLSHLEHQTPFSLPLILRRVIRLLPRLFRLCLAVSLTGILWLIVLGSGIFLIYRSLLGEFDINFYLSQQPREVYQAAGWLFAWFLLCLLPTLWLLGRILIVLPATLAGDYRMLPAVRKAWALPKKGASDFCASWPP